MDWGQVFMFLRARFRVSTIRGYIHGCSPQQVLVTGANGYIGLWVVLQALTRGYSVRAVVRTPKKGEALAALVARKLPDAAERFETCVVADIEANGAFDGAIKDVQGVIHTASPVSHSTGDPQAYIRPAVEGTLGILRSALAHGSKLRRVVITSSICAVESWTAAGGLFNEDHWNDRAVQIVEEQGGNASGTAMYDASKTLSERAAWKFFEDHKSELKFDLSFINPSWVFGPVADDTLPSPAALSLTPRLLHEQLFARPPPVERSPKFFNYIDVRDVAELHIRALELPEAGGQRFIASAQFTTWDEWLIAAKQLGLPLPGVENVQSQPAIDLDDPPAPVFSNEKANRVFGIKLRTVPETLKEVAEDWRSRGWLKHLEEL